MVLVKEEAVKEVAEVPKVYVVGLPHEITESAVTTFFSNYGKVTDVVFKTAADGKKLKGLAYVHFESQESVDKLLEEKTVTIEEKKVHVKKAIEDGGKKGDEPKLDVPPQSLKCVVCKKDKFFSVASYLNHRKGKHHQAVLKIFRAKSASVRQLLRAEAKLAADRQYDKEWMKKFPDFNHVCEICQCQVYCKPEKHNASAEHKMVKNYDIQKCCDIEFNERKKYENHLLSLSHLKKAYEKEEMMKGDGDESRLTMKRAIDIFKQCDADLKEMKETYGELDLNEELPPFDPTKPIGLNFVVKKINYYCVCCDQRFFPNVNLVDPHCRSYNHFSNMQDYILKVERTHAEKRKKEERAESKQKEESGENIKNEGQGEKRKNEEEYKANKKRAVITTKDSGDKKGVNTGKSENGKAENTKMDEDATDEPEAKTQGTEDDEEMDTLEKSDFNEDVADEEEEDAPDEEEESVQDEEENEQDEVESDQQEEVGEDEEQPDEDQEEVGEDEDQEDEEPDESQEDEELNENQDDEEQKVEEIEDSQDDEIQEIPIVKEKQIEVVVLNEDVSEIENPVEDAVKEEEQPVEVEEPKPPQTATRGRRGRGRGRGLRR